MDAVATPFLNEHLASWIMMLVSFPLAGWVIYHVKETSYADEKTVFVDDIKAANAEAGEGVHQLQQTAEEKVSVADAVDKD